MIQVAPHPLDHGKLRRLAEHLCGISDGKRSVLGLVDQISALMVCVRSDCSAAGADRVAERLLSIADHRLGAQAMADAILAEIMVGAA
jgi:hypothetical protein